MAARTDCFAICLLSIFGSSRCQWGSSSSGQAQSDGPINLYGNTEEYGYWFLDMFAGTPPQRVSVIVDTMQADVAFACEGCKHCGKHIDPAFDIERSSTGSWKMCTGQAWKPSKSCSRCQAEHCAYHQGFMEGSSISGWQLTDVARFGDASFGPRPSYMMDMGCHQSETNLFYTQRANGILGLGPRSHVALEVFQGRFSICLAEWGGQLTVGYANKSFHTSRMQYVEWTRASSYRVRLTEMSVKGQTVQVANGDRAFIDIGTTYTYLDHKAYTHLTRLIESHCAKDKCNARQSGKCWHLADGHKGLDLFPDIEVKIGSAVISWPARAYMYHTKVDTYCYGFEDDGPGATVTLGGTWMIHKDIFFDLQKERIGIAQARCPEYRERPAVAPMPFADGPVHNLVHAPAPPAPPDPPAPPAPFMSSHADRATTTVRFISDKFPSTTTHKVQSGEVACEGHNFDERTCESVGCCFFSIADRACYSAVDSRPCQEMPGDAEVGKKMDKLKNLLEERALDKLMSWLSPRHKSSPAADDPSTAATGGEILSPPQQVEPETLIAAQPPSKPKIEHHVEDSDLLAFISNPWAIMFVSAIVFALCIGISLGIICHARFMRSEARTPLLEDCKLEAQGDTVDPLQPRELTEFTNVHVRDLA